MVTRLLVANRGEIALRIARTCREMGIENVLAASEADIGARTTERFDRVVCIGPARSAASYLNAGALISTASALGCDAIHPGYGFLAEAPGFAELCAEHGITFVGPSPEMLRLFGDKVSARCVAEAAGVPLAPGSPPVADLEEAIEVAERIDYPIMLKAAKGGGGKGMRIIPSRQELIDTFTLATSEAQASFGDPSVYIERWVGGARHVEVQIAGAPSGEVIHLGDRDCTLQRRNQKLIEEAPAPMMPAPVQDALRRSAVELCRHAGYDNVATVEFLYDPSREEFYFLEVNPRIQVEHGVTELITGLDVVELQIAIARSGKIGIAQEDVTFSGAAMQCRINAEEPREAFRPSPGRIERFDIPTGDGIRLDSHAYSGYFVPPYYDSLIAKLMVHGPDRQSAIESMVAHWVIRP